MLTELPMGGGLLCHLDLVSRGCKVACLCWNATCGPLSLGVWLFRPRPVYTKDRVAREGRVMGNVFFD